MTKANKSSTAPKRKPPSARTTDMKKKITKSFACQVEAFIKRYRPALEALAKR